VRDVQESPSPNEWQGTHVLGFGWRRGWEEWIRWFADVNRSDLVEVIDDALEAYAKVKGFEPPPKR
jgi:hypothetical protein